MNFYQHHIGDFNNATRHLSRIERSIYRDLLELYYDTESPLVSDLDRLARRCIVADCDRESMCVVLSEFFKLEDDGYHNTRADREIAAYKRMAEGGKRGAEKRWGKAEDGHPIATPSIPHVKANANHEPLTINHEPVLKPKAPATPLPDWLQPEAWEDFTQHRKSLKSAMTPKAQTLLILELTKLRMQGHDPTEVIKQSIMRGWKGFFALSQNGNGQTKEKNYYERLSEHTAILTGQHKRKPADDPRVIHGTAERVD